MNRRGVSLVEAIISIFLLVSGILISTRLFHGALQYLGMVEAQANMVLLAEKTMEQVRGYSWKEHGPNNNRAFSDWTGCPGLAANITDPDFAGMQAKVTVTPQTLADPCTLFEASYPAASRRLITASVQNVTVLVDAGSNRRYSLFSLVARPTCEPQGTVSVTPASGVISVAHNANHAVSATAKDVQGRSLPDIMYEWQTLPLLGNSGGGYGTFVGHRDGRSVDIHNKVFDAQDPPVQVPNCWGTGQCRAQAFARYRGRRIQGVSGVFDMQ